MKINALVINKKIIKNATEIIVFVAFLLLI